VSEQLRISYSSFLFSFRVRLTEVTPSEAQHRLMGLTSQSTTDRIPHEAEMPGKQWRTYQALLQLNCNRVTEVRRKLYLTALSEIFTSSLWPSTEQP